MRSPHWPRAFELASDLAELLGVLGERGDALVLAPQLVAQLAVGLALAAVELAHELGDLVELAGHGDELLVDQRLLAVELGAGAHPFLLEERLVRLEQAVERLVVGVALLVGEAGDLLGERRQIGVGDAARAPAPVRPAGGRARAATAPTAPTAQPRMIPMTRVMRRP